MACRPIKMKVLANDQAIKMTVKTAVATPSCGFDVVPTREDQQITPPEGYAFSGGIVRGDDNLKAYNIREGVEIFGVEGTMSTKQPQETEGGVNFYDYKGNLVASYPQSALPLTELPAPPQHDGLTFLEWNWTLEEINQYAPKGGADVAETCTTADGKTHIWHDVFANTLTDTLILKAHGRCTVNIDWGDGTTESLNFDTSNSINHTWPTVGRYHITLEVVPDAEGNYVELGYSRGLFGQYNTARNANTVAVWFGERMQKASGALRSSAQPARLEEIVLPPDTPRLFTSDFQNCVRLQFISIPRACIDCSADSIFYYSGVQNISLPATLESIGYRMFLSTNPRRLIIPPKVTTSKGYLFYKANSQTKVIVFGENFTEIGPYATATSSGTTIKCYAPTPPTIQSTTFTKRAEGCMILVPRASLNAYKSATNWATFADSIFALEDFE